MMQNTNIYNICVAKRKVKFERNFIYHLGQTYKFIGKFKLIL